MFWLYSTIFGWANRTPLWKLHPLESIGYLYVFTNKGPVD